MQSIYFFNERMMFIMYQRKKTEEYIILTNYGDGWNEEDGRTNPKETKDKKIVKRRGKNHE